MKKSSMVKILACDIEDTEGWSYERRAEFILASVTARGMLPPQNPNSGLSSYDIAMGSNVNTWEAEDEEV